MATKYNTGNAVGSADPRDLNDNSVNIDEWANSQSKNSHPDRLGVQRRTWHGMENEFDADQSARASEFDADQAQRVSDYDAAQDDRSQRFNAFIAASGYEFIGDYAAGITITEYNQVVRDVSGEFWRLSGATSTPYTTTGAGLPEGGAFRPVGDAALRQELSTGVALVSSSTGTQTLAGALDTRSINYNPIVLGAVGNGVANDTAVFAALEGNLQGADVDLMGRAYVVDFEPRANRYFNGQFIVDGDRVDTPYALGKTPFGKANLKTIISAQESHVGFNSGIADVSIPTQSKWVNIYRRANSHGLEEGSQLMASDSYDNGMTWTNHRVVYQSASLDTRNNLVSKFANGRIGTIATRRAPDGTYSEPVFIYSDDRGLTWSSVTIATPAPDSKINFHGTILPYPTSAGGDDEQGFICYSYGINDGVDAFYTTNNGDSWTIVVDAATPDSAGVGQPGLTYALSESCVCEAGSGQWIMFCRNANPDTLGQSNAVAYTSTNMTTWVGPFDTGLYLANNPPQAIYEGGRVWLFAFTRQGRPIIDGVTSHLLVSSAPANSIYNANGSFSSLNTGWSVVTPLQDWDSGYLQPSRINSKWVATLVTQERSAIGARNTLCMLGDFTPAVISVDDVSQIAPKPNLLINGGFDIWQRGVNITTSASAYIADRWRVAGVGSENINASRQPHDLSNPAFRGNPHYYMQIEGTATTGRHNLSQRIESVRKAAGERVTLSFWARSIGGATVPIDEIRAIQNMGAGGSPSPATSTLFASNIALSGTWRKFEMSITLPQLNDKTLGTNDDDYLWIIFYTGLGDYNIAIADVKLEINGVASPFVRKPITEELADCQRYYQKSYPQSVAPGAASSIGGSLQDRSFSDAAAFGVNFNVRTPVVMRAPPTVTLYSPDTGAAGVIRNATASTDVVATATNVADCGFSLRNNAAFTIGDLVRVHYTADAEL